VQPDPDRAPDRASAHRLPAVASRLVGDVGDLLTGAAKARQRVATFAIDGEVRFASEIVLGRHPRAGMGGGRHRTRDRRLVHGPQRGRAPLGRVRHWVDDTAALLRHLEIGQADLFGYSSGSAVAMQLALDHPEQVGKLVPASLSYRLDGLHPGLMDSMGALQPEHLAGLPRARLAVLLGTTHITLAQRVEWLSSMVGEFLDAEDD
jgi:hypothetical protein